MIIWTGWGILAGLIWGAVLLVTQLTVDGIHHEGYYTSQAWPKLLGSVLAAPIIWVTGRRMNGNADSIERQTYGARHTLFWVPMEYWSVIFLGLGVIFVLIGRPK
jgi:hypothetical protein